MSPKSSNFAGEMKIGVFDSGYGGLTILEKIRQRLPEYDYLYLGDNARAPYGTRSFEVIYEYTLQAVEWLQAQGCRLIILACNTASAKALRTIQQRDIDPNKVRVLGVIRPTVEHVIAEGAKHIGIMATPGTVSSNSYVMELEKVESRKSKVESRKSKEESSSLVISQVACPMWVPLIEAGEHNSDGADYFVKKYISELVQKDDQLDTIILGCTHYPLLLPKISAEVAQRLSNCKVVCQGDIVAASLKDYLGRHSEIASDLSHGGTCQYITTESAEKFRDSASIFLSEPITASHIEF